jgi:hypothetical protein
VNLVEFATDARLLGLNLSPAQETLLRAIGGLPLLNDEQREIWHLCTGRESYPGQSFPEVTVIAGARSGKNSRIAAPIVCFEAAFSGHERKLHSGERAIIPGIDGARQQSRSSESTPK